MKKRILMVPAVRAGRLRKPTSLLRLELIRAIIEIDHKTLSETGTRREKDEKGETCVYPVPAPVLCCRRNLYLRAHAAWCCWVRLQSESLLL